MIHLKTRIIALLIDMAIVLTSYLIIVLPFITGEMTSGFMFNLCLMFYYFFTIAYFVCFHASDWQGTIGKKIMGIRVVGRHNVNLTLQESGLRYVLSSLSFFMMGIGHLWIFINPDRKTFHDQMIGAEIIVK